jgi:hypothetical protein
MDAMDLGYTDHCSRPYIDSLPQRDRFRAFLDMRVVSLDGLLLLDY